MFLYHNIFFDKNQASAAEYLKLYSIYCNPFTYFIHLSRS